METLPDRSIDDILVLDPAPDGPRVHVRCVVPPRPRRPRGAPRPPRLIERPGRLLHRLGSVEEAAWARMYQRGPIWIDLETLSAPIDPRALGLVTRRRAWQFQVLPLGWVGGDLVLVTSQPGLTRAARFVRRCLTEPAYLLIAQDDAFHQRLGAAYPWPAMEAALRSGASSMHDR